MSANGGSSAGSGGGNGTTQHYSLRWNNHQSHVLSAFDDLLQNEALVDCTLVCEDTSVKAHKVVLSACSPYFQKIFIDNPCKHPLIVLKDVKGWEAQCIVDFMYKGETSVPEDQLTGLIKAAEGLKVRGLTSSDHERSGGGGLSMEPYHHRRYNSPSPGYGDRSPPHKLAAISTTNSGQMSSSSQSSPISLTTSLTSGSGHPGDVQQPRRKQARPRRRSGDSVGGGPSSLDQLKMDSPPHGKSPNGTDDAQNHSGQPENLSMKRPTSSPAINLVKTESLLEHHNQNGERNCRDHNGPTSSCSRQSAHHRPSSTSADSSSAADTTTAPNMLHHPHHPLLLRAASANGLVDDRHHPAESTVSPSSGGRASSAHATSPTSASPFQRFGPGGAHPLGEHEARVEALQALNFMAAGGGLPPFPHPGAHHHHPGLAGLPSPAAAAAAATAAAAAAAAAQQASTSRPTSTPSTPSSSYADSGALKTGFEFQRISIDRTKMSEEEAFEHAIEMIQTRQMGFRKAADFFSVSKWKLYKTARKRGIYAEIKKQNQAQALSKVPTNVQHFADLGVYKQLKKKTHLHGSHHHNNNSAPSPSSSTKESIFPHLPTAGSSVAAVAAAAVAAVEAEVYKVSNNNNVDTPNANLTPAEKKMFPPTTTSVGKGSGDLIIDDGDDEAIEEDEELEQLEAEARRRDKEATSLGRVLDEDEEEPEDRVLVINQSERNSSGGSHGGNSTPEQGDDEDDSGREDSV